MKISVVTAVRNGVNSISDTINSVTSQTHPAIEHIVVDGASADGTLAVVKAASLRDPKILSEVDAGVYDAFNKGLRLATGDVIAYLNAGDTYENEGSIAKVVQVFETSGVSAVFGDVAIVDQRNPRRVVRRYRSSRFHPSRIGYGFMPAHPTLFLRREIYEQFGSYNTGYRIAGDFELVARIFGRGHVTYSCINEVLVRMPRGGLSTSGPRSNWIITREMQQACDQNGIPTNLLKLVMRFPVKLTEMLRFG